MRLCCCAGSMAKRRSSSGTAWKKASKAANQSMSASCAVRRERSQTSRLSVVGTIWFSPNPTDAAVRSHFHSIHRTADFFRTNVFDDKFRRPNGDGAFLLCFVNSVQLYFPSCNLFPGPLALSIEQFVGDICSFFRSKPSHGAGLQRHWIDTKHRAFYGA